MAVHFRISRYYSMERLRSVDPELSNLLGGTAALLPWALPEFRLHLIARYGEVIPFNFRFDVGADLMVIPVYVARRLGIAYSQRHRGALASSVGGRVPCFYDFVTVQSSLSGRLHRWPCAFADSIRARLLVGRAGFLDDFTVSIRNGHFIVSYLASLSRVLTHAFTRLRPRPDNDSDPEQLPSI